MTMVDNDAAYRMGAILAPQQQQPGILGWLQSPQAQGLAQGLLAASQPSPYPVSFGQALGMGMQGAQQAGDKDRARKLEELMLELKLKQAQQSQQNPLAARGGATGALVEEYMRSTGASFPEALQAVQTGFRQNTLMQDGQLQPIPGAIQAKQQFKQAEAQGSAYGKEQGEKSATLTSMEANMPQLEKTVNRLSELGKKATYTMAGRAGDTARREAGLPVGEGAIARAEYISLVDNQILPLLRQTFGAQFTQKEGESLKITLGDPNKSPEEKDAVLRSFIQQKMATIDSLRRETGEPVAPSSSDYVIDYNDYFGGK